MSLPEEVPDRPGSELTITRIYERAKYLFPDQEIVYRTRRGVFRYTYSDFADRVERLASALSSLGVKGLDRVATMDWNTHWHLEEYYAVPMMGAVLHPVNVRLAPQEIVYTMNQAEDSVLIVNADFLQLAEAVVPNVKSIKHVIVVDADSVPSKVGGVQAYHYEDLLKERGGRFEFQALNERRPAFMFYTSGTTGLPKGVYHSHRQVVLHAFSILSSVAGFGAGPKGIQITSRDVSMIVVPMYHVYAWGFPFSSIMSGQKTVLPGRFDSKAYLELIKQEKVTYFAGVPTILYMLLTDPESEKYDLSGVIFINGGSALPEGLALMAERRGMKVFVGYGLTETAPVLTLALPPSRLQDKLSDRELFYIKLRTGYPIFFVDIAVVDQDGKPVPKDGKTLGEVVVRAPWVTYEYYKDPEKTEAAWRGGWFHTGDLAVWYPDGSILIMDREKDVIKSGGEWISSLRLEDAISQHPGILMVTVIGAKHPKWGERPVALVVPRRGWEGKLTTEEINRFLTENFVNRGAIPKWWLPDKVIEVQSLPLTSTGKADKKVLRAQYSDVLAK
ncbi:Acyl-CoA ligase (acyl-CoA synthetase) [Acidilobus saccharovorans 345-15]|uniref:Acyl-CoA ligase (Acyl-CoA synthetase) n=1 Tax=Acidilobus saccharovorans (strain DSM 16705 / JCM 18335 / VKM B-2471 / 345-15) TaxID=666510 RepID=D9Q0T0_ACIS3|nr:long-chain fatty acid--CoA ligase [Acidilobus saccharovorans]ADL18918.1 Acyl-CoA ligase (acyl-CoA synthetase) [Acidilobus saccharovorans 345-15]